ncbi:hypothetical protein IV102_18020 [bacterium]|nr:hypothetical protein [bacterium]
MNRRLASTTTLLLSLSLIGCGIGTSDDLGNLTVSDSVTSQNPIFQGEFVTTRSTPIAVGPKPAISSRTLSGTIPIETVVWSVNPDNDSVSVFDVSGVANEKLAEIPVGDNPQSVAISGTGLTAYVVNQGSHSVSVIDGVQRSVTTIPKVGPNPCGGALTPDGQFLYVTGGSSGTVTKIDTTSRTVIQTLDLGNQFGLPVDPHGIAISPDEPPKVYVTLFHAQVAQGGREGFDQGKEGQVVVINVGSGANDQVQGVIKLPPINSGFTSDRTQLCQPADPNSALNTFCGGPADPVSTFPNLLQSVTIVGGKAYIPSLGSSPEPPVKFNSNVQGLLTCLDLKTSAVQTVNLNAAIAQEPANAADPLNRVFVSTLTGFVPGGTLGNGYVVASSADHLIKVNTTTLQPVTRGDGSIVRIPVGKNPMGIAITPDGSRAYVQNFISRNVSVIDLDTDTVVDTLPSASLPAAGTPEANVLLGKELFNTGLGPAGLGPTDPNDPLSGRFTMSNNGWGACFNCHPFGLSDGVTWIFPNGPRQSTPLDGTFFPNGTGGHTQRILNWTAVRSSVQDFEKNTENVSGGFGLIGPFGPTDGVVDHGANRGRDSRADAIEAYVTTIQSPTSGEDPNSAPLQSGRDIYIDQGCNACHAGPGWTTSRVNYALPASPGTGVTIFDGQVIRANGQTVLHDVGSLDPNSPIEVRGGGPQIGQPAQGAQGFNVPSLLGAFAHAPYFHDGRFKTLAQLVESGHGQVTPLSGDAKGRLTAFLEAIDDRTPPIPTPNMALMVANTSTQSVLVFTSVQALQGSPLPTFETAGPATNLNQPFHITGTSDPNEAFVASSGDQSLLKVNPFTQGNTPPVHTIKGPSTQLNTPAGVAYDRGRDILYNVNIGGSTLNAFHQARQRTGDTPPDRTITGTPNLFGLTLDSKGDRLYCSRPGPRQIAVFDQASAINGTAPQSRSFTAPGLLSPAGMFLDSARNRLYVADQNSDQIFIFKDPHKLSGTVTPAAILGGSNTGFVFPRNVAVDVFRDQLYVLDFTANAAFIFNSASTVSGNVAPDRVIQGPKLNGPGGLLLIPQ